MKIDAHADTVLRMMFDSEYDFQIRNTRHHIDLPRLQQGGITIQGFAIWVDMEKHPEKPSEEAFRMIRFLKETIRQNSEQMELVLSPSDIRSVHSKGKIGVLLGLEGGACIEGKSELLTDFYNEGIRYMTLTWMKSNDWADSSCDTPRWGGLNPLGRRIIHEMNRLGMMIDLSHASDETVKDVLSITEDPVLFSHSNSRVLCSHRRNLSDDQLRAVAWNGGVVCVNFYPGYLIEETAHAEEEIQKEQNAHIQAVREKYADNPEEFELEKKRIKESFGERRKHLPGREKSFRVIVDHIEHIAGVAGIDHVGIGSDFDGIPYLPREIDDVSDVPKISEELMKRGFKVEGIKKIWGENFLRVFEGVYGERGLEGNSDSPPNPLSNPIKSGLERGNYK